MNFLVTKILPESLSLDEHIIVNSTLLQKLILYKSKKCILLSAPSGSGKSGLISLFIKETGLRYSYYKLDNEDDNLFVFFNYLLKAIDKISPNFYGEMSELLEYYQKKFTGKEIINKNEIVNFTKELINNLYKHFSTDFYIIIDNSEFVADNKGINCFFDFFIDNIPKNIHCIFTTTFNFPFDEVKIKSKRNFFEISAEDFRLNSALVEKVAKEIYSLSLTRQQIFAITQKTNGWITGVHVLLQSMANNIQMPSDSNLTETLHYFFDTEIADKIDVDSFNQLLLSSLFEEFTDELIINALNGADIKPLLDLLKTKYSFVIIISKFGKYKYQDFFREYLREKTSEKVSKKTIADVYKRAGLYSLEAGDKESAIKYFTISNDYKNLIPLLLQKIPELIKNGELHIIDKWLTALPEEIFSKYPILEYYRGLNFRLYYLDLKKSINSFEKFLKTTKDFNEELRVKSVCRIAEIKFHLGEKAAAITFLEKYRSSIRSEKYLPELLYRLSSCYLGTHNFDKAQICCIEGLNILKKNKRTEKISSKANILNDLGRIKFYTGDFSESKIYYKKSLEEIDNSYHKLQTQVNYLYSAMYSGDFSEVNSILKSPETEKIIGSVPELKIQVTEALMNYYFEFLDLVNSLKQASALAELSEESEKKGEVFTALVMKCRIGFYSDDFTLFEKNLKNVDVNKSVGTENDRMVANLLKSLIKNNYTTAETSLNYFVKNNIIVDNIYALFLMSFIEMKRKNNAEFIKRFYEALNLSIEKQYYNCALQMFVFKRELFDLALKLEGEIEPLLSINSEVISRIESESIFVNELQVTDIMLVAFGVPSVYVRGEKINDKDWKRNKFKQIFIYLFLNRNSNITKDILINEFFPDADISYTDNIFHQFLSVLRNILNKRNEYFRYENKVFYFTSGYIFNSDLEKIKYYNKKLNALKNNVTAKRRMLERAIVLCEDIFMKGHYETWVEDIRSEVNTIKVKLIKELISILKSTNETNEAIKYYKMLLTDDDLNEDIYYEIINSYAEMGDVNSAKMKYKSMLEKFEKELGEKPSAQFLKKVKEILLN